MTKSTPPPVTAPGRPVYLLTLTPEPSSDIPAPIRLRRALKCLLRSFGLRCTSVEEAKR